MSGPRATSMQTATERTIRREIGHVDQPDVGVSDQLRAALVKRKQAGTSVYRLGKLAGLDAGLVSRFIDRKRGLTTHSLDRLAGAMGLHLTPIEAPKVVQPIPADPASEPLPDVALAAVA